MMSVGEYHEYTGVDPSSKEDRNNVIYQLDCKNCEAVYVGESKRTLSVRTNEHISAIKSASQRSHTYTYTSAEHYWKYNHDFDWNNKRVLDFEKNWKTKIIKEAIYSEENNHHINGISFKLPTIWKPILQKNKERKTTARNTSPSSPTPNTPATQTNQSVMITEHFDPQQTHKYQAPHHSHLPDDVRSIFETSPKNNMIQDMINSDNMNSTESIIPNIFKTLGDVQYTKVSIQIQLFSQ